MTNKVNITEFVEFLRKQGKRRCWSIASSHVESTEGWTEIDAPEELTE